LDLPGFKLIDVSGNRVLTLHVEYEPIQQCPRCGSNRLRTKESFWRRIRHVLFGQRPSWLEVKAHKYRCYDCGGYFNSRFNGIKPRKRATEPARHEVTTLHHDGVAQSTLQQKLKLGSATVERWYQDFFDIKSRELTGALCPRVMGIDEHFFTRKDGFATTIADLSKQKVFDVVLGRSESSLRSYLRSLLGKERVRVIVMDLSETYRAIAKKHFVNALVVAHRFHVIRLVNHQFVKTWSELDEKGRKNKGLLSLMRRHPDRMCDDQRTNLNNYIRSVPGLLPLYIVWQDLLRLLRKSGLNQRGCKEIVPEFVWIIEELKRTPFRHLQTLGHTLDNWKEEIARMFRFSKTNGITEGLHNKMEMISRRAYGFRNFENYRLSVRVLCG
jgi:transposase